MITITPVMPHTPQASEIVRAYMTDVATRWYGRAATEDEVDQALRDEPYDGLRDDAGVLVMAMQDGHAVACVGARFLEDAAELTKVFTLPTHRGQGLAARILHVVEQVCRDRGMTTIRLDTRAELTEACALYERSGYERVAPFNQEPYSDRWYRKHLAR